MAATGGAFGAPPPGLRMVCVDQDLVQNPFQAWIEHEGQQDHGPCTSVVCQDRQWDFGFRVCMLAWYAALLELLEVSLRPAVVVGLICAAQGEAP